MSAADVNMATAELWATVTLGDGDRMLTDATVNGRPLTDDERAELDASNWPTIQAGEVLLQARIAGIDVGVAATRKLLALLAPWWSDKSMPLGAVLAACPAGVQAEAAVLVSVMNATAGR